MLELPLLFLAGTLGSAHCLGMCGPFAVALSRGSRSWRQNLGRQLIYTTGRTFTYAVLGAVAGFGGMTLTRQAATWTHVGAILALIAGGFLIYQGLVVAGVIRWRVKALEQSCLAVDFMRTMLRSPGLSGVFVAGLFTGLIPCGLVYGFLAMAAATTSLWMGLANMIAFGLGTAPVMIAMGCGGGLLSGMARARLFRVAAWCVVLTGILTIARGVGYLPSVSGTAPAGCPWCH